MKNLLGFQFFKEQNVNSCLKEYFNLFMSLGLFWEETSSQALKLRVFKILPHRRGLSESQLALLRKAI